MRSKDYEEEPAASTPKSDPASTGTLAGSRGADLRQVSRRYRLLQIAALTLALLLVVVWIVSGFYYFSWCGMQWGFWVGQGFIQVHHPAPLPPHCEINQFWRPGWGCWYPRFSSGSCIIPLWIPIVLSAFPTMRSLQRRWRRKHSADLEDGCLRMPRWVAAPISLVVALCVAQTVAVPVVDQFFGLRASEDWRRDVLYWFYKRGFHPSDVQFNIWMSLLELLPWTVLLLATVVAGWPTYLLLRRIRFKIAASEGSVCDKCGYNLTGNVSGVCPECGCRTYPSGPRVRQIRPLRLNQVVLITSTICLSWLGMMMVHEFGHVLGAWVSGGTVERVFHDPFSFSYTLLERNPHPRLVAWAGPMLGVLIPAAAFAVAQLLRARWAYLLRFFAGFCLVANGAYIGAGVFMPVADAQDLLRHGASQVSMAAFGLVSLCAGLLLWHRLGPFFGLGKAKGIVRVADAYACLILLAITIALMAS